MREIHKASIASGALVVLVAFGALAQGIGIDGGGGVPDPLLVSNGSVSAPSYSFASSTNTGIYFTATNTINFAGGGVQKMIVGPSEVTINNDLRPSTAGTRYNGTVGLEWFQVNTRSIQNSQTSTALAIDDVEGVLMYQNTATSGTGPVLRIPSAISVTPATKPACTALANAATMIYIDDTNDALAADVCICMQDSANAFSWKRIVDMSSACTL